MGDQVRLVVSDNDGVVRQHTDLLRQRDNLVNLADGEERKEDPNQI